MLQTANWVGRAFSLLVPTQQRPFRRQLERPEPLSELQSREAADLSLQLTQELLLKQLAAPLKDADQTPPLNRGGAVPLSVCLAQEERTPPNGPPGPCPRPLHLTASQARTWRQKVLALEIPRRPGSRRPWCPHLPAM